MQPLDECPSTTIRVRFSRLDNGDEPVRHDMEVRAIIPTSIPSQGFLVEDLTNLSKEKVRGRGQSPTTFPLNQECAGNHVVIN